MLISEMIAQLEEYKQKLGDVEVLITDGFEANCYRGDYQLIEWCDDDGKMTVDIGIGGCRE